MLISFQPLLSTTSFRVIRHYNMLLRKRR